MCSADERLLGLAEQDVGEKFEIDQGRGMYAHDVMSVGRVFAICGGTDGAYPTSPEQI